jgi:helicase MOV-10
MAHLPIYVSGPASGLFGLVKNYRSHPAILAYSSKHFYDGKLSALAPTSQVNQLCGWSKLPNPNFPMLFYGTAP